MKKIHLSEQENHSIQGLFKKVISQYDSPEDTKFLSDICVIAQELPKRIRTFINDFKLFEPIPGFCIISNYIIDDAKVGRTPAHWKSCSNEYSALEVEIVLTLLGSLLGEIFGWSTQQDGRIIHNVIPIREYENEQVGFSSKQKLSWHTEDAFHPYRGDYIGLACLRNKNQAATTFASIDMVKMHEKQMQVLFKNRFFIRPDKSHFKVNNFKHQKYTDTSQKLLESAYQNIDKMNEQPDPVSVLFGHPQYPYLRIDPDYMYCSDSDREAKQALEQLIKSLDAALLDVILQPGDFCFIDNYKTVHGRKSFKAKYDGTDRWLKRINITRDLRKSRNYRTTCTSRIIL